MRYELSHDTIARQVYAKASAESQTRRKIEKYLADKRSMYEERGALLTQDDLEYIAPYLHAINIGDGERALVEESRTAIEKAERKRRRRLRWTIAVLAIFAVVFLIAAEVAWDSAKWADAQRLAGLSAERHQADDVAALLLAAVALQKYPTSQAAEDAALLALQNPPRRKATLRGHFGGVSSVAYSADGKVLASAGMDGTVWRWDPGFAAASGRPLRGHEGPVLSVAFSPDSAVMASGGEDSTVRIWNAESGAAIGDPLRGHGGPVSSVAFSPDGASLATAGEDGRVLRWDVHTHERIGQPLLGHQGPVNSVAFHPAGSVLVSAGQDGSVRLWRAATGDPIGGPLRRHTGPISSIMFSPTGQLFATAGQDGRVRLWDLERGSLDTPRELRGDTALFGVAFSPDGELVASADVVGKVWLWNAFSGEPVGEPYQGHAGIVRSLVFSPDGLTIASAGDDGTVRLLNVASEPYMGEELQRGGTASSIAFSPAGPTFATGAADGTVRIWNLPPGEPTELRGHRATVRSIAFDPEGRILASAGDDATIRLWHVEQAIEAGEPLTMETVVRAVAFNPRETVLASGGDDGWIRFWNIDRFGAATLRDSFEAHAGAVRALAFSPSGEWLASASGDTVRIWSVEFEGSEFDFPNFAAVNSVIFRSDSVLAIGGDDGTIVLWTMRDSVAYPNVVDGRSGAVRSVAFRPGGATLVYAGQDSTVRLWDVVIGEHIGEPLHIRDGGVRDVAFSADGRSLAYLGDNGAVRLWGGNARALINRLCTMAGRNLSMDEWIRFVAWNERINRLASFARRMPLAGRLYGSEEGDFSAWSGASSYQRTCPAFPSGAGTENETTVERVN